MNARFFFFFFIVIAGNLMSAQNPAYRPIEKEKWEKAVDGKNYNENSEEIQEEEDFTIPEQNAPFSLGGEWMKILIFAVIAALLIFLLIRIFGKGLLNNQKLKGDSVTITDLEDRPMESDLERFLREAIESKNYRLAVRIYYLLLLKSLQDRGLITWKKNKTNFDYLIEVSGHPNFHQLNNSTLLYEFIWYGEKNVAEPQFKTISVSFQDIIQKINTR